MSLDLGSRVQEGALSALKTPALPPPSRVVPLAPEQPAPNENRDGRDKP